MTRLVVASKFAWSEYPGLRPGRIYAGKPDLFKRPAGESHVVGSEDATQTLCGLSRALFPNDFAAPEEISADRSEHCATCWDGATS